MIYNIFSNALRERASYLLPLARTEALGRSGFASAGPSSALRTRSPPLSLEARDAIVCSMRNAIFLVSSLFARSSDAFLPIFALISRWAPLRSFCWSPRGWCLGLERSGFPSVSLPCGAMRAARE